MPTMLMPMLTAPVIDLRAMAPVLIVFAAACVGVLVDGLMLGRWRSWRDEVQIGLVLGSSAAALVYLVLNARESITAIQEQIRARFERLESEDPETLQVDRRGALRALFGEETSDVEGTLAP